jgi:hypothetical protein
LSAKLETTDILETVTGSPSDQKAIKEEENKQKEKEEKMETQTLLIQQVEKLKKRIFQINFLFFLVNFNIRNNRN